MKLLTITCILVLAIALVAVLASLRLHGLLSIWLSVPGSIAIGYLAVKSTELVVRS